MSCLEFEKLSYVIGAFNRTSKTILKGISGEFRSYGLSAIMGPSGGGKTTLLNILSGFTTKNVSGTIKVNGNKRDNETFRKRSAYIMQDENLHSLLTVHESMNFSIKLKTGSAFSAKERKEKILEILQVLGLDDKMETFAGMLSGGQQRRLSIALELVDDPQIMFFDEPTTGLDSSSSTQCLSLMKKLAQSGKTIICTIHQPSALLFEMFDHLYALSDGMCIYQGSSKNLVPFLTELDLVCPESYNPSDYLLEIATNDYGPQNDRLTESIQNGQNQKYHKHSKLLNDRSKKIKRLPSAVTTSLIKQIYLLVTRNYILLRRDKILTMLRLLIHLIVGVLVGILYYHIGNNAAQVFNLYKCLFIIVGFLAYTSFYSLLVSFPIQINIIKREHFNRHYSTGSYYIAQIISDIPITILCTVTFIVITYILTNQPMDGNRLLLATIFCILHSFAAQSLGLVVGSIFGLEKTLIVAAFVMLFHIMFSGVIVLQKDIAIGWQSFFDVSFFKYTINGVGATILGMNRTKFDCDVIYCHFKWPHKFMEFLGIEEDIENSLFALPKFIIVFHIVAYFIMRHRLKH